MTKNEELFNMIVKSRAIKQYAKDINFDISDEFMLKLARNANISKHMMFKVFKEILGPEINRQQLMDVYYSSIYHRIDPIPHPFKSGDLVKSNYGIGVIMSGYSIDCWKSFENSKNINVHLIEYPLVSDDPDEQEITHAQLLSMEFYDINKIKNTALKNNAIKLINFYKATI